jgi:hypothetical protein
MILTTQNLHEVRHFRKGRVPCSGVPPLEGTTHAGTPDSYAAGAAAYKVAKATAFLWFLMRREGGCGRSGPDAARSRVFTLTDELVF